MEVTVKSNTVKGIKASKLLAGEVFMIPGGKAVYVKTCGDKIEPARHIDAFHFCENQIKAIKHDTIVVICEYDLIVTMPV